MSDEKEYSILLIQWASVDASNNAYQRSSLNKKDLPTGFVSKEDGLYYEGTFTPGQTRSGVFIAANKALSALLGV